jgi:hypothetical protein
MNLREERLVAELETMGVSYLSRHTVLPDKPARSPERFLADLICQPSSRVRMALIAVLLAQPDLAKAVPAAMKRLKPTEQNTMKLLYTAAVILQQKYADRLREFLASRWQWLPDLYVGELDLDASQLPDERLCALGQIHRQHTGIVLNWTGSYENVAHHLLHRWEVEQQWNQ